MLTAPPTFTQVSVPAILTKPAPKAAHALLADGVRSTDERFRNEIEKILDMIIPKYVPPDRLIEVWASEVTDAFDWPSLVERLCGPPLRGEVVQRPISDALTLWD